MLPLFYVAVWSYLLGSIPFGYILVRAFRGEDIRASGSGNIGATNVSRSSPILGVLTLLFDAAKGFAAVALSRSIYPESVTIAALAGLFAVCGHLFPVWLKFRGGKGVATGLGSFLMLAPKAVLVVIAIFLVVVVLFRYVSLGSIIAVACFPVIAWWLNGYGDQPLALGLMSFAAVLVVVKHHANIRRLVSGTESRFRLRRG
jgi:acyl phosphate:glycerol-3-phosphate acyltransferase